MSDSAPTKVLSPRSAKAGAAASLACALFTALTPAAHAQQAQNRSLVAFSHMSDMFSGVLGLSGKTGNSKSEGHYQLANGVDNLLRALYDTTGNLEGIEIQRGDKERPIYIRLRPQIDWTACRIAFADNQRTSEDPTFNKYFDLHKELMLGMHVLFARQFKKPGETVFRFQDISIARNDARQAAIASNQATRAKHGGPQAVSSSVSEHPLVMAADLTPVVTVTRMINGRAERAMVDDIPPEETLAYAVAAGLPGGYYGARNDVHIGVGTTRYWAQTGKATLAKIVDRPESFMRHGKPLFQAGPLQPEALLVKKKLEAFYGPLRKSDPHTPHVPVDENEKLPTHKSHRSRDDSPGDIITSALGSLF